MKFDEYGFHYPADIASIANMANSVRGLSCNINGKTWGYDFHCVSIYFSSFQLIGGLYSRDEYK